MLPLIFLVVLVLSAGGLVFLVVRKLPILVAIPIEGEETEKVEKSLAKEKIKLLARKFLIFAAQKAMFSLRWLEKTIQMISEKARRFYHRQKRREDIQEDVVKKQEEIAKNSDYWHTIRYGFRSHKKKDKHPTE